MSSAADLRSDFDLGPRILPMAALAALIGFLATLGAWALMAMIRFFTNLFYFQTFSLAANSPANNHLGLWAIGVPAVGGLIVGLIARFGTDKIRGHGIPEAIEAILFGQSKLSPKVAVLKPISAGITIGSGGPFGAEGPVIMTGGAIGSLLGQLLHLSAAERKAFLVAGAAAGMTAVFGTPLAAVLLAVEVLLFELRPRSLVPVAIACTVAGFARPLFMDSGPLFALQTAPLGYWTLISCLIAGVLSALLGGVLSRSLYAVEDFFARLPIHWMWWPALGGIVVGIGGYFEPRTLGVGYDVINGLLHNQYAPAVVLSIVLIKTVIWLVALGSLTSGGVLAPVLTIGAGLGVLLGVVLGAWFPGHDAALWPLLCMAGVLGGVLHAPLMAAFFAFGITGDVNALLPLLGTTMVSYAGMVLLMPRSILTEKIARRGLHVWRETGVDPLERYTAQEWMSKQLETLPAALSVAQALAGPFGAGQKHRAYPVLDGERFVGIVDRQLLLLAEPGDTCAQVLEKVEPSLRQAHALPQETCRTVATRMARLEVDRLPVLAEANSTQLLGLISRSDLIKPALEHYREEEVRERPGILGSKDA